MKRPAPEDELEMGVLMARLIRTKVQEAAQAPETVPEAVQAQDWQMQEAAPFPEAVQVRDDQMQEVAPFPEPVRDDADDYEDEWWGGTHVQLGTKATSLVDLGTTSFLVPNYWMG